MLFIATPLYENKIIVQYLVSLIEVGSVMPLQYSFEKGPLGPAREILVKRFLRTDCEFFLFIDADISFTSLDVLSLIAADLDVVSGLYRYQRGCWRR